MNNSPAFYLGKIVSKDNFRVFIYAPDGSQKLVESWSDYENHMQTGLWFALKENAVAVQAKMRELEEKPKRARKAVEKKEKQPEFIDDFLPSEGCD